MSIEAALIQKETANKKPQNSAFVKMMLGRQQLDLEPDRKDRRTDNKNRYRSILDQKTSQNDMS